MRWPQRYSPKGKFTNIYFRPKRTLTLEKNENPAKNPKVLSKMYEKNSGLKILKEVMQ